MSKPGKINKWGYTLVKGSIKMDVDAVTTEGEGKMGNTRCTCGKFEFKTELEFYDLKDADGDTLRHCRRNPCYYVDAPKVEEPGEQPKITEDTIVGGTDIGGVEYTFNLKSEGCIYEPYRTRLLSWDQEQEKLKSLQSRCEELEAYHDNEKWHEKQASITHGALVDLQSRYDALEKAAKELKDKSCVYRDKHDMCGDDSPEAGRAWVEWRRAIAAVEQALKEAGK